MNATNTNTTGATENHIHGINCGVTNCYYNSSGHVCTAKAVQVGPQYAASSADTICSTFKPQ